MGGPKVIDHDHLENWTWASRVHSIFKFKYFGIRPIIWWPIKDLVGKSHGVLWGRNVSTFVMQNTGASQFDIFITDFRRLLETFLKNILTFLDFNTSNTAPPRLSLLTQIALPGKNVSTYAKLSQVFLCLLSLMSLSVNVVKSIKLKGDR